MLIVSIILAISYLSTKLLVKSICDAFSAKAKNGAGLENELRNIQNIENQDLHRPCYRVSHLAKLISR
jgi:hypothetical protein